MIGEGQSHLDQDIKAMYFSPTGTTEKTVKAIAVNLAGAKGFTACDFTLPEGGKDPAIFKEGDLVVVGVPVYAGRIPNVLLPYLDTMAGNGASAIAVVVYGNRDYDDALIELKDTLIEHDFRVIAGGAFIGEHSFSTILGANRPDKKDLQTAKDFAARIADKLKNGWELGELNVKGKRPYRKYYMPKTAEGQDNKAFRQVTPLTSEDCTDCKTCAEVCPMGSIDYDEVKKLNSICIKCCACIKRCPVGAKYFDDPDYLFHKNRLEAAFTERREPELFL